MSRPDRKAMLDRDRRGLSIRRQCVLLSLARSGIYRPQRPANDDDLVLMRRIDQLFLAWPFLGSRRMTAMLRAEGLEVNRKRVRRLMRLMGIAALGPKPRTTKALLSPTQRHSSFLQYRSIFVDVDDRLGEGLRSLLGQIVTDAALDDPVRIFAREFFGIGIGVRVWFTVGIALGDCRHVDDGSFGVGCIRVG